MDRRILILNPGSGGSEAAQGALAAEAERRRIEVVRPATDAELPAAAARVGEEGAAALAIAGGDGSQQLAAGICAERDIAYVCVPGGTRNHFALDLGIDRDDPVGALAAFDEGTERRVDLGYVNSQAFVNNASFGLYAEAVSSGEYRESKLRTALRTLAGWFRGGRDPALRWTDGGGEERVSALLLVSNNPYRFSAGFASGHRERLDGGELGVVELRLPRLRRGSGPILSQETATELEIATGEDEVRAALDGEPRALASPLRCEIRPGALRALLPRSAAGR